MNFCITLLGFILLFGACGRNPAAAQIMDYQTQENQHVVVVVLEGITPSQAKEIARQRAAELTVQQGNRYFVIESENEAILMRSNTGDYQNFSGNLYEELIIEKGMGKESQTRGMAGQGTSSSKVFRLTFSSYAEKPPFQSIDACKLTDCN